jgi:thiol-disulfide isomerase/thioredoxin
MNKKSVRILLQILLAAVVVFVIFDFVRDYRNEQQVREEASQTEISAVEEADETDEQPTEDGEFDYSEDLETESETESENAEETPSPMTYGADPGYTIYDFELQKIGSDETVKISDFRGQKVFLNFWASWCPPCVVEAPHLQSFAESQDDVVVLGVNVTVSESDLNNVQGFIDEHGLTFPNVYGAEEMFDLFYVESLPTSLFIDSKGVIQERVVGPVTEDVLNAHFSMID